MTLDEFYKYAKSNNRKGSIYYYVGLSNHGLFDGTHYLAHDQWSMYDNRKTSQLQIDIKSYCDRTCFTIYPS